MTASTLVRTPSTFVARVRAEVRESLPVWLNVWISMSHLYTALAFFEPNRLSAFATLLFPLSWAVAYYLVRRQRNPGDATVIATLCATAPAIGFLLWLPVFLAWDPADQARMHLAYELFVVMASLALLLHCRIARGWPGVVTFFLAAGMYGLLLESSGITLGYFSEAGYHFYFPWTSTPVAAVAGWCTIFYPSVFIAEALADAAPAVRRSSVLLALLAAVIALCSDLHFDPLATALGFWVWNERLSEAFLGVPLVNFTSWLTAVFAFALAYFTVMRRAWTVRSKARALVVAVPLMQLLAGLTNLALIAALEGPRGPSVSIFRDALTRFFQGT